jgi:hypothetical protein
VTASFALGNILMLCTKFDLLFQGGEQSRSRQRRPHSERPRRAWRWLCR